MHNMKPAADQLENDFALKFLGFDPLQLGLLLQTAVDPRFRVIHKRLANVIFQMISYRTNQIESNCEDACSVQDPHFDQWTDEEIANGIIGLEAFYNLAESQPAIREWVRLFDRILVSNALGRWLGQGDQNNE